ncbi:MULTISPECIES: class C sortase [unclassified Aerococcus]|uniref:class C sortase n=1 Tax=unclassified Aerococcus TaxID=2618060 RepID=UPI0025C266BC|nr:MULTISPECIES: class C sortase [unclassified Aerococcus]
MKSKYIGVILFVLGLAVFIFPLISKSYYENLYRQEVSAIHQEFEQTSEASQNHADQVAYNQQSVRQLDDIEIANVTFTEETPETNTDLSDKNIIATMSIPAIDLNYPIYDGANDENLYNGLARVDGTSYPVGGINTNSVIAGHNGLAGKIYFSDVDELVNGDTIQIQNQQETLTYEVYNTAIIKPDEVSALAIIPGQDTLTLLTCIFLPHGVDRYLVYAKRIDNPEQSQEVQTINQENTQIVSVGPTYTNDDLQLWIERYGVLTLILLFGLILAYWIFFREKRGDVEKEIK